MVYKEELLRKDYMRKYKCPKCLARKKKQFPNMIDCAFKHNNDEHLCSKNPGLKIILIKLENGE